MFKKVRQWAIWIHHENTNPAPWAKPWSWGQCRLCLFTWQGMIEEHDPDCPASPDGEASEAAFAAYAAGKAGG